MPLIFGGISCTGVLGKDVTLPDHQDSRRQARQPQNHLDQHQPSGTTLAHSSPSHEDDSDDADGPAIPFPLRSYHTPNLTPVAAQTLRRHELRQTITTLRLLGYDLEAGTSLTDPNGDDAAGLAFFHHFTDPIERMLTLTATAHVVTENLRRCLEVSNEDERVDEWKRDVSDRGREVVSALEDLVTALREVSPG